uniref:Cytochrome b5 domain-containing protein 1 n=1 Tax=Cyprinodon variegatus TaxID=28743 RepID=A0A3Q2FV75_CYPVA
MERPRFFTPSEVASHRSPSDLWVSFLGGVWDLSPLVRRYHGDVLLLPIMEAAGKDISNWFDPQTKDVSLGPAGFYQNHQLPVGSEPLRLQDSKEHFHSDG